MASILAAREQASRHEVGEAIVQGRLVEGQQAEALRVAVLVEVEGQQEAVLVEGQQVALLAEVEGQQAVLLAPVPFFWLSSSRSLCRLACGPI